jgi:hypothetical protein
MLALAMLLTFAGATIGLSPAQAGLITTSQVLTGKAADPARTQVRAFLAREDVRSQLSAWGLDPAMANARVDSMTDEEVARMAQRIDRLPAGGDLGTTVVVASLIVFLVLLATDIMGYTDVFPFVN